MLEPRRINSNILPEITENLGNGNWYYNYDIKEEIIEKNSESIDILSDVEKTKEKESEETKTIEPIQEKKYSYILVRVPRKPEYKLCVELIIRKYISQTQEFDLINSANKAILANDLTNEDIVKYKEYLAKIEEIKEKVKKDFNIK